jgi:hypothetical protein
MHKSRFAGFIIDCRSDDQEALTSFASFWGQALGMKSVGRDGERYERLDATSRDLTVEVQCVDHESRVHLDIETDDIPAEVARLEKLGAKKVKQVNTWWVMEAPTGHRFCVVRAKDLTDKPGVTVWK